MPWDEYDYDDDPAGDDGPQPCDLAEGDEIALVPCPECGREIVDDAEMCPCCGCWVRSTEYRPPRSSWVMLIALAALAGIAAVILVTRAYA